MRIEIDVPETTDTISVTVVYHGKLGRTMTCRCFKVTNGVVADEDGENRVVKSKIEDKPCG